MYFPILWWRHANIYYFKKKTSKQINNKTINVVHFLTGHIGSFVLKSVFNKKKTKLIFVYSSIGNETIQKMYIQSFSQCFTRFVPMYMSHPAVIYLSISIICHTKYYEYDLLLLINWLRWTLFNTRKLKTIIDNKRNNSFNFIGCLIVQIFLTSANCNLFRGLNHGSQK